MSFGDLSRINTNVQAQQANTFLQRTNQDIGLRQLRLATGSQLNRAEDDSAGYSISKKLEARVRGQAQALSNVGDAKSMLTVGEGALNTVMDILQTMKEKSVQAANDTMGEQERTAIQNQLDALRQEIDSVLEGTTFNGTALFGGDGSDFQFQVGAESGDRFQVAIEGLNADRLIGAVDEATGNVTGGWTDADITFGSYSGAEDATYAFTVRDDSGTLYLDYTVDGGDVQTAGALATGDVTVDGLSFNIADIANAADTNTFSIAATAVTGGLIVNSHENASAAIATVDAAINTVSEQLANIGDSQQRLTFKQENLQVSMTNYEAARSRINDADFAKEQMELVKLQILQQTGTAALAQANSAPQAILSLIG
jgi:flagellin